MGENWETREQLLAAARAAGHPVSPSQARRLYRADLISRPRGPRARRARGTESRYPPGTAARLIRVMEARSKESPLTHVAWRRWWKRVVSSPCGAQAAHRSSAICGPTTRVAREALAGDETGEPAAVAEMDRLYTDVEKARMRGPSGKRDTTWVATGLQRSCASSPKRAPADSRWANLEFDPNEAGGLVERAFGRNVLGLTGSLAPRVAHRSPRRRPLDALRDRWFALDA